MTNERLKQARRIITDHVKLIEFALTLPESAAVDAGIREAAIKDLAFAKAWLVQPDEPEASLEHLEAPALRRIVARHVRWHDKAMALLKEAANLERKPADLARLIEFIDQSETRLVLAQNR